FPILGKEIDGAAISADETHQRAERLANAVIDFFRRKIDEIRRYRGDQLLEFESVTQRIRFGDQAWNPNKCRSAGGLAGVTRTARADRSSHSLRARSAAAAAPRNAVFRSPRSGSRPGRQTQRAVLDRADDARGRDARDVPRRSCRECSARSGSVRLCRDWLG